MAVLKNRAKMSTSTTGTGSPITLGSAEDGYQTFADAGVANADVVRYVIEDGNNWEIGTGTYTSSGTTLSRTVSESSNSDAAINLSGSATVFIGATAEDIPDLYAENYTSGTKPATTGTNAVAIGKGSSAAGTEAIAMVDGTADSQDSFAVGGIVQSAIGGYAIGKSAQVYSQYGLALGKSALVTGATDGTAVGVSSVAAANSAVALAKSRASGADSFAAAIVNNTSSYGSQGADSISIGLLSKATALGGTAIGYGATSTHVAASAFGTLATTTATNQIALGGSGVTARISGAYNLPTSDGTNGQVLTTNGSGSVTFADAGGGGGADLYAANESSPSAQPSATGTNAIAIGDSAVASGQESVAFSKSLASGQQSFAAALSSNSSSYGAQGYHSVALGERSKATGYASVALGFGTATASNSFAAFTSNSGYASATNSFAFGSNAQASGYPSVAMGYQPEAKAEASVAMGYRTKITSYGYGSAAFGIDAYVAVGSKMVLGGRQFSSNGDCQTGTTVLKGATTDATALQLASGYAGSSPDISNQVVLPNNSAYSFSGTIIARESAAAGSDYASWEIKGALLRDANAASTVLGNGIQNKLYATSGASAWAIALSADTTNGGLKIEVTGAASTNIRWVATVNTSEVTYA